MSAVLVVLMVAAALAAVLYPLFGAPGVRRAASAEGIAGEERTGYLSSEELEFDYRSGKLDPDTYRQLAAEQQSATTLDADIEAEVRRRRAARPSERAAKAPPRESRGPADRARPQSAAQTCARCGAPVVVGDSFCARCGSPVAALQSSVCPSCAAPIEPDDAFCARCGCRLS